MKKICRYILDEIQFVDNRIVPCGSRFWDKKNNIDKYWLKPDETLQHVDFDLYFKRRDEYIKMYKEGIEPEFCKDCCIYEPVAEEKDKYNFENYKFKKIHINHKTICSCRCIYCCLADNGDLERFKIINQQKTYDIRPILLQIDQQNLIDENTELCLFGGECTEYPDELEFILDYGLKHNSKFVILSNGIIYNKKIEEVLKKSRVELRFSLDSGTKEIFEKIKRVKAYDRVMSNIENYAKTSANNPNASIQFKYVICPGINDNLEELKKFLSLANKYNAKCVILSINRFWLMENSQKPLKNSVKQMIKYWHENKDYPDLGRAIDNDELWDWWVQKNLNDKGMLSFLFNKKR